jgi:hypothetical protein
MGFRWSFTTSSLAVRAVQMIHPTSWKCGRGSTSKLISIEGIVDQGRPVFKEHPMLLKPIRVMSKAFTERGRPEVVKIDVIPITDGQSVRLTFHAAGSQWRQGVWLATDTCIVLDGQKAQSMDVWKGADGESVDIVCHTSNGVLWVYNIWERNGRRESQLLSSGMLVDEQDGRRRYRCNDSGFETAFDKVVFSISYKDDAEHTRTT